MSHLFGRMDPVGCTCTAVCGGFAAGTCRSMCYLERNTSRGEDVSRKVIKRKNEIICKTYVSHLCSHVTRTGPNCVTVRGKFAAGTGHCCKNWEKIQAGEERCVEVGTVLYATTNYNKLAR